LTPKTSEASPKGILFFAAAPVTESNKCCPLELITFSILVARPNPFDGSFTRSLISESRFSSFVGAGGAAGISASFFLAN